MKWFKTLKRWVFQLTLIVLVSPILLGAWVYEKVSDKEFKAPWG